MNSVDLDLFVQFRDKDDQKAFDTLFHKYYAQLCRFAYLIVKEEALAEEVVQETFIHVWENRKNMEVEKSLSAYLYSAVRHRAINHYNRAKTRIKHENIFVNEVDVDNHEPQKEEDVRLKSIVNEAIQQLPDKCKDIFCMARFEGLTHEEIADYLQISKKTVENQMTIAFQKIREYLHVHLKSKDDRRMAMYFLLF